MPRDPLTARPALDNAPQPDPDLDAEDAFAELVDDEEDVEQLLDGNPPEEPPEY